MHSTLQIITIALFITGILYLLLLFALIYGWLKTPVSIATEEELTKRVSVIIAARNEEYTLPLCLRAIINQSYPTDLMEIIVVDDNSTDATAKHIKRFAEQYNFIKWISLDDKNGEAGKKTAIEKAVQESSCELIITTDADCVMDMDWLKSMVSFQTETSAEMVVGPVSFHHEKNIFEKLQSMEFMSLIASGAGALYFNKAILCNGANLMYTRKAFREVGGFKNINSGFSGEDVLLMYKLKNKFPKGIKFIKNEEAIVYTKAKRNLLSFLQQRKRWASKKITQLNFETITTALIVYLFNFSLLFYPLLIIITPNTLQFLCIWLLLLFCKYLVDFLLLFLTASFFKKTKGLFYFILSELLYIPYITCTGLLGIMGGYTWKGRKIKR